jgi:hypothetical protein
MAFLAMSQTYRGEGFGRADNHDPSVSVDAQKMDVPGGSLGCAGGNGAFEHSIIGWILFDNLQGETGFDDGSHLPESLSERVNFVL